MFYISLKREIFVYSHFFLINLFISTLEIERDVPEFIRKRIFITRVVEKGVVILPINIESI